MNPIPKDSTNPAAQATVKFYTVLPTTAAQGGGVITAQLMFVPSTAAGAVVFSTNTFDWTKPGMLEPIILQGSNETLELSFGTTTANAPQVTVMVEWTEKGSNTI